MLILSAFHFFLEACEGNRNAGKIKWELVKGKEKNAGKIKWELAKGNGNAGKIRWELVKEREMLVRSGA
jgi:hypothetical protein